MIWGYPHDFGNPGHICGFLMGWFCPKIHPSQAVQNSQNGPLQDEKINQSRKTSDQNPI